MNGDWSALAIHPQDSVAVVLRDIAKGEAVRVRAGGRVEMLLAAEALKLGHKIARVAIAAGTPVLKYGAAIGSATADIAAGAHVHVHNIASDRARKAAP
jgi:hypothetical protein